MAWKNIKDHYHIGHIVQIREGLITIGSRYVSDLLLVSLAGEVTWGSLGPSKDHDLDRYYDEMTADPAKLKRLIDEPDTFATSLPVYTYGDGEILEKQCEAYGHPNCTHDGLLMFNNTFSKDKSKVVKWAKENFRLAVENGNERLKQAKEDIEKIEQWRADYAAQLAKLNSDYPET